MPGGTSRSLRVGWNVPGSNGLRQGGETRRFSVSKEGVALIKIRPRGNESIQQMLKRFKRLCQREGLTRDMKRHSYYEKPSERKRRQSRKAARKAEREDQQFPR